MTASATFHHEAMFYAGDDEFVARSRAFVEEGLDRGEPVLVMVRKRKLELLRQALGERAAGAQLVDMEVLGRNPARIIPAWGRFVSHHAEQASGGMHGLGEPIWAERDDAELTECQLHESLINLAFAAADSFNLICPYDTEALPENVIAEARRSHPVVSRTGERQPCPDYCGIEKVAALFHEPLPDPPADFDELSVNVDRLGEARRLVRRRAEAAGLGERVDDLVLAVNEILSNSLTHAHEDGRLRVWDEQGGLVCEVHDRGHILQPLIGREEPARDQIGGHGLWLVNLVCDLVQVRSSAGGSTVRMKMGRDASFVSRDSG